MGMRMTEDHTELSFRYMRVSGSRESLIDFLIRRFRYLDQEQWIDNILNKRLLVDGGFALPGQILRDHQKIVYLRPDFMEPEVDENFEVIYEDESLISLNKPSNLPTSPSGKYFKKTLVNLV